LESFTLVIIKSSGESVDLSAWGENSGLKRIIIVAKSNLRGDFSPLTGLPYSCLATDYPLSGAVWNGLIDQVTTPVMVTVAAEGDMVIEPEAVRRLVSSAGKSSSSLIYSNYVIQESRGTFECPTIDYQLGSIRDDFDFGPVRAWSMDAVRHARFRFGPLENTVYGALYDLRLRTSVVQLPKRIPEPLYCCRRDDRGPTGLGRFDYLDPQRRLPQKEMEQLATDHLKRIGAYLAPEFLPVSVSDNEFPLEASIIIPVRNRQKTIAEAVGSALEQKTDFSFNVIVVDNHSDDGTTRILERLADEHDQLVHMIPEQQDLGIGGCWNLAVQSEHCGRIAVQLDSDDLYADMKTLQTIVDKMNEGPYAMVVGSYRLVDFDLNEIPPGLIDHREWTRDNGRNNLLRVNGLGAPRAFDTAIFRRHPMPNVSYGEDYAVGLRISRYYEVGRIYEPVYLCRRWEDNSDADLPIEVKNRYDSYKDRLRSEEILARQQMNRIEYPNKPSVSSE